MYQVRIKKVDNEQVIYYIRLFKPIVSKLIIPIPNISNRNYPTYLESQLRSG